MCFPCISSSFHPFSAMLYSTVPHSTLLYSLLFSSLYLFSSLLSNSLPPFLSLSPYYSSLPFSLPSPFSSLPPSIPSSPLLLPASTPCPHYLSLPSLPPSPSPHRLLSAKRLTGHKTMGNGTFTKWGEEDLSWLEYSFYSFEKGTYVRTYVQYRTVQWSIVQCSCMYSVV